MIPAEIETILPEMVELARRRRRPVTRHTSCGWFLNASVLRSGTTSVVAVILRPAGHDEVMTTDDATGTETAGQPGMEQLQERFGLTRAEARVVRLLQQRYTNREVAERLSISPHTARHHTEKILLKLGIARRSEVPARITEAGITPEIPQ